MFDITKLLSYDQIVIQCHNDPDPDAIASAFALYTYLAEMGKDARIIYGGDSEMRKANMLIMVEKLNIPVRYIKPDDDSPIFGGGGRNVLVMVDCQYGARNARTFYADEIVVIDHHKKGDVPGSVLCDIRPSLGSCSTLVWELLRGAGFDFNGRIDVGTALYYGLYTDTGSLSEIVHPLDKDLRDIIKYDTGLLKRLRNSNLTIGDLTVAANTLNNRKFIKHTRIAVFEAETCDPSILGFTSDLAIQVDDIEVCIVFCENNGKLRLSVRSCVREVMADELVKRICVGIGDGGGHQNKAGGTISVDSLKEYDVTDSAQFLLERVKQCLDDYDKVYCGVSKIDTSKLGKYRKNALPIGFVCSEKISRPGTELLIRTLEGDTYVTAAPDIYIMVGSDQSVWPIRRAKFEASYKELETPYEWDSLPNGDRYEATVKEVAKGEPVSLLKYVKSCVAVSESMIYAMQLDRRTKVFTEWNLDGYMFGDIGDYFAVRYDDVNDAYIIRKDIFEKTYTKIEGEA